MKYLEIGSFLQNGKYKIVRVLGQGGFGITYEGLQVGLNRKVVIKEFFLREYCERDGQTSHITSGSTTIREIVEKFREKFIKEAQMIASFDRAPHIVPIYDIFEENGTAYYVMRFIEGGSLSSLVKEHGALPVARAVSLISQIGQALSYLHSHQTMHLDVKPANILLDHDADGNEQAVLIDFGISKHYTHQGQATTTSPIAHSKGFAPLEQYREGGVQEFSPTSDVYSLGATLYYLLTAQIPPEATLLIEDPLERPAKISSDLWQVVSRAMESSRKRRYQTVDEMIQSLKSLRVSELKPKAVPIIVDNEETFIQTSEKETTILEKKSIVNTNRPSPSKVQSSSTIGVVKPSSPVVKPQINKVGSNSSKNNQSIKSKDDNSWFKTIRGIFLELYEQNSASIILSIIATIILFFYYFQTCQSTTAIVCFIIGFLISTGAQIAFQFSMYDADQKELKRLIPGLLMGVVSYGVLRHAESIGESSEQLFMFVYISKGGLIPVVSITGIDLFISFVKGIVNR